MEWSWTGGASEWTIPSPNVRTPPLLASTWVGRHITEVGAAAAVVDEEEIHITIVDMIDMTVMMSMTTDTAGGVLHHLITADTGLAQDLVPTAHDDTKKILTAFYFFLPACIQLYIYKDMKYM